MAGENFTGGRQAFTSPGNSRTPNRPVTMPGFVPKPVNDLPQSIDPTKFANLQSGSFTFTAGQLLELLSEPPSTRIFLIIKNSLSSIGSLGIGFNNQPNSLAVSSIELAPGGYAFFDEVVPQNRLFGVMVGGVGTVVVTWANR